MRKHWLIAAGAAALLVGASASGPSRSTEASLNILREIVFQDLCGPNAGAAMRRSLEAMIASANAYAQTLPQDANAPPPLLNGLGDAHFAITTASPDAQAYFDQGVRYLHAFNHAEAVRSFRHAQQLDPQCGMCFWGEAFALGPNINAPMEEGDFAPAFAAMQAAHARRDGVTPLEHALIDAMQARYVENGGPDRAALDAAFADAMNGVADAFPDNNLAQVLAAEAAMDTQPWDYWEANGRDPKGRIGAALGRIETVLARSPNDSGAIHLYIHLVEASADPWRSEQAAERLAGAAPQAGHLVHMPAHIYYRIGRFRDSIRANIDAVATDEAYIRAANPSPIYQFGYYPHNVHFVLTSAAMGGDGRTALDYAERLDEAVPMEMAQAVVLAQPVKAAPWFARAQFATPRSVLDASPPPEGVSYVTGAWRYARAIAHLRSGDASAARGEIAALDQLIADGDFTAMNAAAIPAEHILQTYSTLLNGRVLMAEGDYPAAIAELRRAVEMQAEIPYMEPPYIYYPLRRTLGAAYLRAGQPALAEQEFLQTLIESPNDAYAYWGLQQARRARGNRIGANAARLLFNAAFLGRRNSMSVEHL